MQKNLIYRQIPVIWVTTSKKKIGGGVGQEKKDVIK